MPCELKDSMPVEIYAALLGAFIGVLFTYWFALLINKAQNRNIARANFRSAFSYTISQMSIAQTDKSINIDSLLTSTFPNLATAIETYRPFVPRKNRKAYQAAWQKYYMPDGMVRFYDYSMHGKSSDGTEHNAYETFTHRINSILEFAKL